MTRLRPLRPTTTQIERIKRQPVGSGFLLYHSDDKYCSVVEFVAMPETGELLRTDGTPLTYTLKESGVIKTYRIVLEDA